MVGFEHGGDEHQLSFAQERLWFLEQFQPGAVDNIVQAGWRLSGELDRGALEAALSEVVARHHVLRTVFAVAGGQPRQVVRPTVPVMPTAQDLSSLGPAEAEFQVARIAAADTMVPFDLHEGPLLRVLLVRLSAMEHVLIVSSHQIVTDGWSMEVLARELTALYEAFVAGRPSPLASLAIQYADYAAWQRERLQGKVLESYLEYWRERLAGGPPTLGLATDHPRPAVRGEAGATVDFTVGREVADALRQLGREHGVTLFMTLLAAFQVLLGRYASSDDVIVGSPTAGRVREELEGLIGYFVNTLVLRTDCSGDPSFTELLRRVRDTALGAYEHQDLPFEKLVEELVPARDPSITPLFQVAFVLQSAPTDVRRLEALEVADYDTGRDTAKFDLTLKVTETSSSLDATLNFSTELFERATAERMAAHFQNLLASIAADPSRLISELELLGEHERHQLLVEWNATAADVPAGTIAELFEAQVAADPAATAVVCNELVLSYGQLNTQANQLARHLRGLGVGQDVLVAICLDRAGMAVAHLVAQLAVLKAGGAYVPIDPAYPAERLAFMLSDSSARVMVTTTHIARTVPSGDAALVCLDSQADELAGLDSSNLGIQSGPNDLAYVLYTSGSTGRPKGVLTKQSSVTSLVTWHVSCLHIGPRDRLSQLCSLAFESSCVEIWPAFFSGATLVVVPDEVRASPTKLLPWLEEQGITVSFLPTTLADMVLDEAEQLGLRVLVTGGDRLRGRPKATLGKEPWIMNQYGPTECTVCATAAIVGPHGGPYPPIGRAIANYEVFILDRWLKPVPVGVPGEIYIGGAGLARGYLNRPGLTAERFVCHPFSDVPGARMYRTGDMGRFQSGGEIEFLGRADRQVKVRGFRIECGEVEAALAAHPGVAEAVVVTREDMPGDRRLVAYLRGPQVPGPSEARAWCAGALPDYMVPSAFVALTEFPLTPHRKLDWAALPAPEGRPDLESAFSAPRTPTEEIVAAVWAEALGLPQVGVHDDFFDLGGHSLVATKIVRRVRAELGTELALKSLFAGPTVAEVAAVIDGQLAGPADRHL